MEPISKPENFNAKFGLRYTILDLLEGEKLSSNLKLVSEDLQNLSNNDFRVFSGRPDAKTPNVTPSRILASASPPVLTTTSSQLPSITSSSSILLTPRVEPSLSTIPSTISIKKNNTKKWLLIIAIIIIVIGIIIVFVLCVIQKKCNNTSNNKHIETNKDDENSNDSSNDVYSGYSSDTGYSKKKREINERILKYGSCNL